jgi:hypothetical protein
MIIRAAREVDAPAMGQVMVDTYMTVHRHQMPDEAWTKRAEERTPEVSANGWARTLREIATDTMHVWAFAPWISRRSVQACRRYGRASQRQVCPWQSASVCSSIYEPA